MTLDECRKENDYLRAENRELWREMENRLLTGFQTSNGGWILSCRVCGARHADRHLIDHGPDCPFTIIPELAAQAANVNKSRKSATQRGAS